MGAYCVTSWQPGVVLQKVRPAASQLPMALCPTQLSTQEHPACAPQSPAIVLLAHGMGTPAHSELRAYQAQPLWAVQAAEEVS